MKLSIVIPVYQSEATLDRCVESVASQTFSDLEIILVDDGSPDRCPQMCDNWALRDSRISVIHKENGGLSSARNAGINKARGELITFVDADDFVDKGTYEQVVPLALEADIVEYAIYWQYGSDQQQLQSQPNTIYSDMQEYWLKGKAYAHSYACNKVFRRELFEKVRFPEGRVFEDAATLPLLLQRAYRVVTTSRGCYYYCANQEGITAKATGRELGMLLESHIGTMNHWCDDAYYMHVLNIQMDVFDMTCKEPVLPHRYISPTSNGLNTKQRLKAIMLNLLGIKGICKLNNAIQQLKAHRS